MSVGISSVDAVLARIAQIQSSFVSAGLVAAPASALGTAASTSSSTSTSATGPTGFATALADAQSTTATSGVTVPGSGSVTGDQIVASAKKYLGVPYVFGGTTSTGLDCSGLVQRAYGDLGISLPRIAADQARTGTAIPSLDQAKPGDILGFGDPAHHVAIYLGNNMMIAAPEPGENVKIQSVYETPASIRRIVGTAAAGSATPVGATETGQSHLLSGGLSGVNQYASIFAQNEARYHLPHSLLASVAETESAGNASAVSPAGAQGLMQLMPGTARGLGVDPWNPAQAVQGAAQLLSGYLQKFGSVPLALAAYNAGPGAVEQYGGVPPYTETQNYVTKITGLMAQGAA